MTVPSRVRADLARRRAAGDDFDAAWALAIAAAPSTWTEALEETRASWAAAFAGEPNSRSEAAVRAILVLRELAEVDGPELHGQRGRRRRAVRHELVA